MMPVHWKVFLRSAGFEADVYYELYELLDQSFSIGNPYFIYEFCLKNGMQQSELRDSIDGNLPVHTTVSPIQGSYTTIKRISDVEFIASDHLSFTILYEFFTTVPVVGGSHLLFLYQPSKTMDFPFRIWSRIIETILN